MSKYLTPIESSKFGNFQIPACQNAEIILIENTSWTVFFEGIKRSECRLRWEFVHDYDMIAKFRNLKKKSATLRLVIQSRIFACKAKLEYTGIYESTNGHTLTLHFLLLDKPWQETLGRKK